MSGSFVVEVSRRNLNSSESFYTTNNSITVGNDLQNSIRIREPSIEKVHLRILFDKMSIFVSGKDVFLNENPLEVGQTYPFSLGDTIKIHDVRLTINKTESKQEGEGTFIKPIPTETISELSTIPADEVEVVAMIEKDEKEIFIKKEVHTNQFIKGDVLVQEVTEKIKVEEKEKVGMGEEIMGEDKGEEGTMEVVDLNPKGDSVQTEEVNFIPKGDSIQTEDVNFKNETTTEDVSLNPKKDALNTTTEEVNFNEKGENTFIKDSVELQKAVKILDNEEKNNLEMALEDGDLTSVKEAITNKKDDLNSEIRDTIEPEITVTDTPIDPTLSRRVMKDLGEVVLEKEILNDAEKVVDEKLGLSEESLEENKVEVEEGSFKESAKEDEGKDNSKDDEGKDSLNEDEGKDNSKDEGKETLNEEETQTTSTPNSLTKPKSTPSKKNKVVNKIETPKKDTSSSTSFISRTPRRAASQTTVENPLMTPIPKRTKRNSTAPKSEKPKKK